MTLNDWRDISVEARLLVDGAIILLVVQILAALVDIAYTVWKWIKGERKAVTVYRKERRFFRRKVWKRAEDYRPVDDPRHPHTVLRAR